MPECWKFPNPLKKGNNISGKNWWGPRPLPLCKMTMQCVFFTLKSLISAAQHKVVFSISYTDIFQKSNYRYAMFCLLQFIRIYCEWKNATYCQTNFSVVKTGPATQFYEQRKNTHFIHCLIVTTMSYLIKDLILVSLYLSNM